MNIFSRLLSLLKVRHTRYYSEKLYGEHPYKNTLFGLSQMLEEYKIETMGLHLNDKDELANLIPPFIAQAFNDFVLVTKIQKEVIEYTSQERKITTTLDRFKKGWSGVILLVESNNNSLEPNYFNNIKKISFRYFEKTLIGIFLLTLCLSAFLSTVYINIWQNISLIILSYLGLHICYLILLKQIKTGSNFSDILCSLFKKGDCGNLLESSASKFMGVIGWSEVGFSYFLGNLVILLFFPEYIDYLVIINIATLLYSVWSIWYQKYIAQKWCPLCIIVMLLLWGIFIINFITGINFNIDFMHIGSIIGNVA